MTDADLLVDLDPGIRQLVLYLRDCGYSNSVALLEVIGLVDSDCTFPKE